MHKTDKGLHSKKHQENLITEGLKTYEPHL